MTEPSKEYVTIELGDGHFEPDERSGHGESGLSRRELFRRFGPKAALIGAVLVAGDFGFRQIIAGRDGQKPVPSDSYDQALRAAQAELAAFNQAVAVAAGYERKLNSALPAGSAIVDGAVILRGVLYDTLETPLVRDALLLTAPNWNASPLPQRRLAGAYLGIVGIYDKNVHVTPWDIEDEVFVPDNPDVPFMGVTMRLIAGPGETYDLTALDENTGLALLHQDRTPVRPGLILSPTA